MIRTEMQALGEKRSTIRELFEYGKQLKARFGEENVYDFSIGNPSIPCPSEVTEALRRLVSEEDPVRLHSYTSSAGDNGTRAAISAYIKKTYGEDIPFEYIYMTAGAAASLTISLNAVAGPGEEVIILTPCFPEYPVFIAHSGAEAVSVPLRADDFQLDEEALRAAVNERTAAVLINSPHNPTGTVLTEASLAALTSLLKEKEAEFGHEIYLISDEPYRELNYTGRPLPYLTKLYEDTIVCYSFSKSLSLPGERIGYVLVSPKAARAKQLFAALAGAGRSLGFVCAPSLWQFVIRDVIGITSDVSVYRRNRDLLYEGLTAMGYSAVHPDGAFYLFLRAPGGNAVRFSEAAKEEHILVVPSDDFGMEGYVRVSYCVDEDMIRRSLPAFQRLYERMRNGAERNSS